jgi:ribosomal protein S18 acetylase RimI-like enzyme
VLRRAHDGDVAAVSACVQRAYARYADRLTVPPKPVLADYATVVRDFDVWLLADVATGGCAGVLVLEARADHLYIDNVAVDPEYQGRGLGRELLDFAESEARRLGLSEVRLYTNALMTENQAIYAKRGYVITAREHRDGREIVFMSKRMPPE